MESQVGPHTLLRWVGSESAMWKEPLMDRTCGWMTWWSNRIQLKAPYTPSLMLSRKMRKSLEQTQAITLEKETYT